VGGKSGGGPRARAGRIKGRNIMPLLSRSYPKIILKRLIPVSVSFSKFPHFPSVPIMSGRVTKRTQKQSLNARERKIRLAVTILARSVEMPSYSHYRSRGIEKCKVSLKDSSRYAKYIRLGRSSYDVTKPSLT
jgi:hypothetical protein